MHIASNVCIAGMLETAAALTNPFFKKVTYAYFVGSVVEHLV